MAPLFHGEAGEFSVGSLIGMKKDAVDHS